MGFSTDAMPSQRGSRAGFILIVWVVVFVFEHGTIGIRLLEHVRPYIDILRVCSHNGVLSLSSLRIGFTSQNLYCMCLIFRDR